MALSDQAGPCHKAENTAATREHHIWLITAGSEVVLRKSSLGGGGSQMMKLGCKMAPLRAFWARGRGLKVKAK